MSRSAPVSGIGKFRPKTTISKSYTSKVLSSAIGTGMEKKTYRGVDDALYFNNLALNSLKSDYLPIETGKICRKL